MDKKMYEASCDPMCGFKVRSHEKPEIVDHLMLHVKSVHPDKQFTQEEASEFIEEMEA